jgi:predicted HAD superfamily Cof-like phosphohydrolase
MDNIVHSIYDFNEQIIDMPQDLPLQPLTVELREWFITALQEEITEYRLAHDTDDLIGQVDAILDMIYFAVGRLKQMGLTREQAIACFDAVHTANMTKRRGAQAKRGNVEADAVKPNGWVSPEEGIKRILFGA